MRVAYAENGFWMTAYAGTTGILLAMDVEDEKLSDLLGFSIKRYGPGDRTSDLEGLLQFEPPKKGEPLEPVSTFKAPIQKFRWSDYCVYPDTQYTYDVYLAKAPSDNLNHEKAGCISIKTEPLDRGKHQVIFNRSVAASQSYARRFQNINPFDKNIHEDVRGVAKRWLARGMVKKIEDFMNRAHNDAWALDIAIYEIEEDVIIDYIAQAIDRGTKVKVLYHAKEGDEQTKLNREQLERLPDDVKFERVTDSIFHHKFIVLSSFDSSQQKIPVAVLTGSTNFTETGLYTQANLVHVIENSIIAGKYAKLFEKLLSDPRPAATKSFIEKNFDISTDNCSVIFSPRKDYADKELVIKALKDAKSEILFCVAFKLHDKVIKDELTNCEDSGVIRYGLFDDSNETVGWHRCGEYVPAGALPATDGFYGERTHGNFEVHLKTIITDFTTDTPTVITGSNNFSNNSSKNNDENMVIIRNDTRVADIYLCEMLRLFDHYRFRWYMKDSEENKKPMTLKTDITWLDKYKKGRPKRERERFSGSEGKK